MNTDRHPLEPGELWKYVTIERKEMVVLVIETNLKRPHDRPRMDVKGPWANVLVLDAGELGGIFAGEVSRWPVRQQYGEDGGWKRLVP